MSAQAHKRPASPYRLLMVWSGAGLLVVAMLLYGIFGMSNPPPPVDYRLSPAPTLQPSATLLPTNTPYIITATPTFSGPTPLWVFLPATYTPTPFYGGTPHPRSEAYKSGINRFNRGDWQGVLTFMEQVLVNEPGAADANYYMAEAYRMQGDFPKAIEQYDKAVQVNNRYAPAYLGRARARLALAPGANVDEDLNQAVALDPVFGEAYLELAKVALGRGDAQAALQNLGPAEQALPVSPRIPLYRAEADLILGNAAQALDEARQANEMDRTSLESYLVLGQALQANGLMAEAVSPLQVYLIYQTADTTALLALARSYAATQKLEDAIAIYTQALQEDEALLDGWLERGRIYLELGDPDKAMDDFFAALKLEPRSFAANLERGRALLAQGDKYGAYQQIERTQSLANGDREMASLYYYRAQVLEAIDEAALALNDWQALLDLPEEQVPAEWASLARGRVDGTQPFTP